MQEPHPPSTPLPQLKLLDSLSSSEGMLQGDPWTLTFLGFCLFVKNIRL